MEQLYLVIAVNHNKNKSTLAKIYDYTNKNGERVEGIDKNSIVTVNKLLTLGDVRTITFDAM